MKQVLFILEGAADLPAGGVAPRTPLAASRARHAARLAVEGASGLFRPDREMVAGRPELSLAALLGISAKERRWLARAPLEAAGEGIPLHTGDVVYRANFITLDGDRLSDARVRLGADEMAALVRPLQEVCRDLDVDFHLLGPGALLAVFHHAHSGFPIGTPPTELEGESVRRHLPGARANERLRECLSRCAKVLGSSSVNAVRVDLGENPANALWLWGGGPPARVERAFAGARLTGFALTNSAMASGLARTCGMDVHRFRVPGDDHPGSPVFHLPEVVESLRRHDLALVYLQAPREGGRYGGFREKTMAIESLDFHILGPFLSVLESFRPYRILVTADLAVGAASGRGEHTGVPFVLAGPGVAADGTRHWDEETCASGSLGVVSIESLFTRLCGRP